MATLLATAVSGADRVAPVKGGPEVPGYTCLYYSIPYHKLADAIWDCAVGPDGRVYIGMCSEHSGGSANLMAFDLATETFEDVFDAQELTKSPMDRMPQGKIHFTLNAHPDGRLFGATHFGYLKSTPEEPDPNGCYRMTAGSDGSLYAGSRMDGPVGGAGRKKIESQGAFWLLRLKPAT